MARYCIAFESMKLFLSLEGTEELSELVGKIVLNLKKKTRNVAKLYNDVYILYFIKDNSCLPMQGVQ